MSIVILAILALCALAMLMQRPTPPTVVIVERAPSSGIGCEPVLLAVVAGLVLLILVS